MPKLPAAITGVPTKSEVRQFLKERGGKINRRRLAREFGVTGSQRSALNSIVRDLADEHITDTGARVHGKSAARRTLPPVAVIEVVKIDANGDAYGRPIRSRRATKSDLVLIFPNIRSATVLRVGDRILARLTKVKDTYHARMMRLINPTVSKVLGIYVQTNGRGRLKPTDRKLRHEYAVSKLDSAGAQSGELVLAEVLSTNRKGMKCARITDKFGCEKGNDAHTFISIHTHGIPYTFPDEVLAELKTQSLPSFGERSDLTRVPFITIDPEDARDFDDAVWAEADDDRKNVGGWHIVVAIADVAHFVRPATALDRAARERGNSVYFPDRVVPMLPPSLSADLCSLLPGELRPCVALHMWVDSSGRQKRYKFERAMMRSAARLTYGQVQKARDGYADNITLPFLDSIIMPLYGAYQSLKKDRTRRAPLNINTSEWDIRLNAERTILGVSPRPHHDSHKLIEEFMIQANTTAASSLEERKTLNFFRVHESPDQEKLLELSKLLKCLGYKLALGSRITPEQFNRLLTNSMGTQHTQLLNEAILRCQAKAHYNRTNIGHFGLNLNRYTHFTSPIRRYADLQTHRALISSFGLGEGGLQNFQTEDFDSLGVHLSMTERRAMVAERESVKRFISAYMVDKVGNRFTAHISGVARFGIFVVLDENGSEGFIPMRYLTDDYYEHRSSEHALIGRSTKTTFRLGDPVEVQLQDANPMTGSIIFELL